MRRDPGGISTLDEHAGTVLLDEWPVARSDAPLARRESDPSLMLGLVLLVAAAEFVLAACAAGIAWLVA